MLTILLVVVVLMLIGAMPTWRHSRGWGYYPSGGLGLVSLVLVVLLCQAGSDARARLRLSRDLKRGATVNVIAVVAGVAAIAPARGRLCGSRSRWTWCVVLLVLSFVLATPTASRADIGVIVLEPIGALGFFTRVGHAGTYFSNICQEGSPIRMRLCLPGESGGVVSKYSPLSEHEDYDWAIVPFEEYMHGVASADFAPMIGTAKLQSAIEQYNFGPLFSGALKTSPGALPDGQWKAALATRFDRNIYILSVETSAADDAVIIAAFNAAPNKSRFNFFYRNCSNQAKAIFALILPRIDTIGDRTSGITMETPKGLAKALVDQTHKNPELNLRVRRYAQIPGTFSRSRDVLFPMENTYRSLGFAPWWFFGGFREVALGAMLYHEVISPFGMLESSRDFISARAAQLTLEQRRLRRRQDAVRQALASAHNRRWWKLSELDTEVFRRLGEIRNEKRAEVTRVAGSTAQWQELDMEFRTMVRALSEQHFIPEPFGSNCANGSLSNYNLYESAGHREDIEYVQGMFALFGRRATPSAVRLADDSRGRLPRIPVQQASALRNVVPNISHAVTKSAARIGPRMNPIAPKNMSPPSVESDVPGPQPTAFQAVSFQLVRFSGALRNMRARRTSHSRGAERRL